MKRICIIMLIFVLCMGVIAPVMAQGEAAPRLVDQADLLTDHAEETLRSRLDAISEKQGLDVVVVTVASLNGQTPEAYADHLSDDSGYAQDAVLLLVSMEERDWWISGSGEGEDIFSEECIEEIGAKFQHLLGGGEYAKAFDVYASECESAIVGARLKAHVIGILVCIGIGLLVALIATGIMKGKLKSVHAKVGAADYVKSGSLNVTHRQDLFLYREVQKRPKPKSNSSGSHTSASGRSHSGGGGKF